MSEAPQAGRALAMDVVDRKRAEEALAASEARFRGLFDRMAQGVVYFGADGRITSANAAARRIFRLDDAGLVERDRFDPRWRAVREDGSPLPPEEIPSSIALRTGEEVRDVVFGVRDGDDRPLWLLVNAIPSFRPGETKPSGAFVTFDDISERKRAEEERLRAARREARLSRLESHALTAGAIAHDFNNLLTALVGFTEAARASIDATSPAQDDLAQVLVAAGRATDLCRQMLSISGKGRFVSKHVRLGKTLGAAVAALAPTLPSELRLSIDAKAADEEHAVVGDDEQLGRLLANLVTNSIEALAGRPSEIRVRLGEREFRREELDSFVLGETLAEGRYVFFDVVDDGPGMDAATQALVFDPFFSTKFVGRGLGIPEALGIARAHGGSLRITSAPSEGASVRVVLPAVVALVEASPASASPTTTSPTAASGEDAPLVLVVDDEPALRRLARRTLERAGYRVEEAGDGLRALELFRHHGAAVSLVVLDLTMPVLDGDATLHELRRLDADLRVIVSSGYAAREVEDRFAGRGVTAFLSKPYPPSRLLASVQALIGLPGPARS